MWSSTRVTPSWAWACAEAMTACSREATTPVRLTTPRLVFTDMSAPLNAGSRSIPARICAVTTPSSSAFAGGWSRVDALAVADSAVSREDVAAGRSSGRDEMTSFTGVRVHPFTSARGTRAVMT